MPAIDLYGVKKTFSLSEGSFASLSRKATARLVGAAVLAGLMCMPGSNASAAACANEALRGQLNSSALPDCRAFEMVTPPYKEGYAFFPLSYSANGEKIISYSLANLADNPGVSEDAIKSGLYQEARGENGWGTSPLNAPLSEFIGQLPIAFEADKGLTLWNQHTPQESANTRGLYIRSAAGGYSFVGRLNPNPGGEEENDYIETVARNYDEPVGATSNYGHILLLGTAPEDYWSFDETKGIGSLYEYSGTGNTQPVLVSVEGAKGSDQLVGECGSAPGGGQAGSELNALSNSGETIFFTVKPEGEFNCSAPAPRFAEVYARLQGSMVSPQAAETVDVTASECSSECGEASGKNFEGASDDGSRAFFTSTQKLTNDAVDGTAGGNATSEVGVADGCEEALGSGCNLYEYNFGDPAGHRLKLIGEDGGILGVAGVAPDGSRVYFVSTSKLPSTGTNIFGKAPQVGEDNLYMYDTASARSVFIATLSSTDQSVWRRRMSQRSTVVAGDGGQFLVFASKKPGLTPDDEGSTASQLFEYDAETSELVRITKGEEGFNEDGRNVGGGIPSTQASGFRSSTNSSSVSVDGQTVVFVASGQLSPLAVSARAGCSSVYEYRSSGLISNGSVHLVSDGRDVQPNKGAQCGAQFLKMDGEGGNILFSTADALVPSDVDDVQRDVYDAREGGGFAPGPILGESGLCIASLCEGLPSSAPGLGAAPGSVSQSPEGANSTPPPGLKPVSTPKKKRPTESVKLARALKACGSKTKKRRAACQREARQRYGSKVKAKKSGRGGK